LPGYNAGPDGKFSLPDFPPGRYRLAYHPKAGRAVNPRVTFYWSPYPHAAIDLAFGQHIVAVQFKMPN